MNTSDGADVHQRLEAIERKLDLIIEQLGIGGVTLGKAVSDRVEEVGRLIDAGKKIQAIKLYRELTGTGLREAKAAVDAMDRRAH
jgi:ribosomal protein L7/L12